MTEMGAEGQGVKGEVTDIDSHEVHRLPRGAADVDDEGKLDGDQLDDGLGKDHDVHHDLLGSGHLQLLEDVLEDEGHLGACPIDQEQPGQ